MIEKKVFVFVMCEKAKLCYNFSKNDWKIFRIFCNKFYKDKIKNGKKYRSSFFMADTLRIKFLFSSVISILFDINKINIGSKIDHFVKSTGLDIIPDTFYSEKTGDNVIELFPVESFYNNFKEEISLISF